MKGSTMKLLAAIFAFVVAVPVCSAEETIGDLLASRQAEKDKSEKARVQPAFTLSAQSKSSPPLPRLMAIRGMNDKLVATLETDAGKVEASLSNPELPDGWRLVAIHAGRVDLKNDARGMKIFTVYLSGRAARSDTLALPPAPPALLK